MSTIESEINDKVEEVRKDILAGVHAANSGDDSQAEYQMRYAGEKLAAYVRAKLRELGEEIKKTIDNPNDWIDKVDVDEVVSRLCEEPPRNDAV